MDGLNRRDFLKAGAVATSATAAACAYDYKVPQEEVLPYVVNPENVQPGLATYYASLCNGCATACGLVARNNDGRVVGVEGNPDHPSGPGLCTRGHFDLIAAYGPDRLPGATARRTTLSWADADKQMLDAVAAARAAGKTVAWLGRYRTGTASALLDVLAEGGLRRVHWETLGVEPLLAAARIAFGVDELPVYELAGARTVVSFGFDFADSAFGSMAMRKGFAKARNPASDGFAARLVAIEPRLSSSSIGCDDWVSALPGTETQVALALAKLCAAANGYSGAGASLLSGVDVNAACAASGIAEARLTELAAMLTAAPSVVLPGGPSTQGADATALAVATLLCNQVLGAVGTAVQFGRGFRPGQVNSFADVKSLVADAAAGKIGVLFLDGIDAIHALPAALGAADALAKVDLVVQFADEANDSTGENTLVLPTGSGLEQWSDASVESGLHVLGQPSMLPLHDSRGLGDTLLTIAKAWAPAAPPLEAVAAPVEASAEATPAADSTAVVAPVAAPPSVSTAGLVAAAANFGELVKARWTALLMPAGANAAAWWQEVQTIGLVASPPALAAVSWVAASLPEGTNSGSGDRALVLFASHLGDGRWANVPWAQELPDPVSTYFWNTWIEINPRTAESLGLGEKDLVKVETDHGSLTVGWFGAPTVREDTVALRMGNGKTTGKYAKGRGANAFALLGGDVDPASGALNLTSRVRIARAQGESGLHALCGSMNQDGRTIAARVNAADAVANVEGEAQSIVPIHHLPTDPRVEAAGPVDMFPEPQHPTYRFSMVIDTNACNGCGACQIACAVENNTPFVGPDQLRKGRTMSWIRMDRFFEGDENSPDVRYLPAICQHCAHAPCEGVCPVLATYHNLDGLNAMIYNRCVGTRYCANNCPYTARRFNYHTWEWPQSYHLMLNPELSTREMGVMEKCTFCVQRVRSVKDNWRDAAFAQREPGKPVSMDKHRVPDAALQRLTACAAACPSEAINFGNWNDIDSTVRQLGTSPRAYTLLGELNTKPGVRYMAKVSHHAPAFSHGGGHGGGHEEGHGDSHTPTEAPGGHGGPDEAPAHGHGAEHKEG